MSTASATDSSLSTALMTTDNAPALTINPSASGTDYKAALERQINQLQRQLARSLRDPTDVSAPEAKQAIARLAQELALQVAGNGSTGHAKRQKRRQQLRTAAKDLEKMCAFARDALTKVHEQAIKKAALAVQVRKDDAVAVQEAQDKKDDLKELTERVEHRDKERERKEQKRAERAARKRNLLSFTAAPAQLEEPAAKRRKCVGHDSDDDEGEDLDKTAEADKRDLLRPGNHYRRLGGFMVDD